MANRTVPKHDLIPAPDRVAPVVSHIRVANGSTEVATARVVAFKKTRFHIDPSPPVRAERTDTAPAGAIKNMARVGGSIRYSISDCRSQAGRGAGPLRPQPN